MANEPRTAGRKSRVLVVDDHPIVREGLTVLINQEPNMEVCGGAESAPEALQKMDETDPDAVIVDLSLKEGSGLELIKDIKSRSPDTPMLVLSMREETVFAERALRAGARGYVMKEAASANLITALRKVLDGGIYLSDRMAQSLLMKVAGASAPGVPADVECLTDREIDIFRMLGSGMTTREIAAKLHRSAKTIESHRENMKRKLNCRNASELLHHAVRWVESEGTHK